MFTAQTLSHRLLHVCLDRLCYSHEHGLFGFPSFDELHLGLGELSLNDDRETLQLIQVTLQVTQQRRNAPGAHLVLQVLGVLQVDVGDLLLTGQTSQVEGKVERAGEKVTTYDVSLVLSVCNKCIKICYYTVSLCHN